MAVLCWGVGGGWGGKPVRIIHCDTKAGSMFTDSGSQAICDGLSGGGGGGLQLLCSQRMGLSCQIMWGREFCGGMIGRRGLVGAGLFVFYLLLAVGVGWVWRVLDYLILTFCGTCLLKLKEHLKEFTV